MTNQMKRSRSKFNRPPVPTMYYIGLMGYTYLVLNDVRSIGRWNTRWRQSWRFL